jgi:hypothetical protein
MPRHIPTIIGFSALTMLLAVSAAAQGVRSAPVLVGRQASAAGGQVRGLVQDDLGRAVGGASIVALGAAAIPVMARSDTSGLFTLSLPPGDYILRATRDGYVSTYREPVRIQSSTRLERKITLVREGAAQPRILLAGTTFGDIDSLREAPPEDPDTDHPHNETAWRLRHLTPTALRDIGADDVLPTIQNSDEFRPKGSFVDWMMGQSARAATSFFSGTSFTGQLNFLTTSTLGAPGSWVPTDLPHGVAYAAVGAPVGTSGEWKLRGAMSAGMSSWAVVGEYAARQTSTHAFSLGLSFSSKLSENGSDVAPLAVNDRTRSVGGMYFFDHWQLAKALEVTYGARFDRYDYVAGAEFLSPQIGLRVRLLPGTHVTASLSQRTFAPGADEFLPPSVGPWLPPERTFSPLLPTGEVQAERVREYQFGIEQRLGPDHAPTIEFRRFRQSTENQAATLFGLDAGSDVGHYYVATPGSVDVEGMMLRATAPMGDRFGGTIAYSIGDAAWTPGLESMVIAAVVPSAARAGSERNHDLTTSLNANIPETATKISLSYRVNSAFAQPDLTRSEAAARGRFDLEFRQALALRPTRGSRTELLLVVRNLFRDVDEVGSMYDELLTVAPPMRIMGGFQVRF